MRTLWAQDERLVNRALAGDPHATAHLLNQHYPELIRFITHLTGHVDAAEEIAQETLVRAWRRLDTYRGQASFKTWIHTIAYREFLAERERSEPTEPLAEPIAGSWGLAGDFSQDLVDAIVMERAILTLPETLRVPFLLVNVQGLSAREAAEVVGIPRGTVLSRLATARTRILAILAPGDDSEGVISAKPLPHIWGGGEPI